MSDLLTLGAKTQEGDEWRGTIEVSVDGELMQLTVRQLYDPEMRSVMSLLDMDEIEQMSDDMDVDQDVLDEYQDLQDSEDLTENERERLQELEQELEAGSSGMFDALGDDTFKALRYAARCAVVPDDEDIGQALGDNDVAEMLQEEYGMPVTASRDDAEDALNRYYADMLDRMTGFTSYVIGMQALMKNADSKGN